MANNPSRIFDMESLAEILNISEGDFNYVFPVSEPETARFVGPRHPLSKTINSSSMSYQMGFTDEDGVEHNVDVTDLTGRELLAHDIRYIGLHIAAGKPINDLLLAPGLKQRIIKASYLMIPGNVVYGAARALLAVLEGQAEILRCQAIKPRSDKPCGKYFVRDLQAGNKRQYCSTTCKNRILARKRRVKQ